MCQAPVPPRSGYRKLMNEIDVTKMSMVDFRTFKAENSHACSFLQMLHERQAGELQ